MRIKSKRRKDKANKSKNIIFVVQEKKMLFWMASENSLVVPLLELRAFTPTGQEFTPGQGTKAPQAMRYGQKVRNKNMEYKNTSWFRLTETQNTVIDNTGEWHWDHNLDKSIYFLLIMLMLFCLLIVFWLMFM